MDYEILDTQKIWEYVHGEEFKEQLEGEVNDDYLFEEERLLIDSELDYLSSELQAFISRYEKRYKTDISNIVFIGSRASRYGAIGGSGRTVGKEVSSNDLRDMDFNYDRIAFHITADNKLQLVTADHDGANYMELVLVTSREQAQADELGEDVRAYIDDKAKRSSKLDNKFLAAFGCLR